MTAPLVVAVVASLCLSVPAGAAAAGDLIPPPVADQHNEYVFTDLGYYVYNVESGFALVDTVRIAGITQLRDAVADARGGFFYISYGSNHVKKWDFVHKQQIWDKTYSPATDAGALSPDGSTLYMATGSYSAPNWLVINTADGTLADTIKAVGNGSHNTDISLDGRYVFLGIHNTPHLGVYDTLTKTISYVSGLTNGVRPMAVDGGAKYAFVAQTGLFGFSVGDIAAGTTLYTVTIQGFPNTSPGYVASGSNIPSHGIAVSPDEREVWVIDKPSGMVHVFDVTGLPGTAPRQIADIALASMDGNESECSYSCFKEGWVQFSRDGRYVYVGDTGAVVDAQTKLVVARLPELSNSRKHIEVDWYQGKPVWGSPTRSSQGFVRPNVPAPTAGFTAAPSSGTAPLAVQFSDMSTGSPTGWAWSFGDGTTSTAQNPAHTFTTAGAYTATLTATNASGASAPATQTISVTSPPTIKRASVSTLLTSTASGTRTIAKPSGTAAGDVLVSCLTLTSGSVTAAPAGWTRFAAVSGATKPKVYGYYKVATASEPASYKWTTSSVTGSAGIARYSGARGLDGAASSAWSNATATTATVPGLTTTTTNVMLVGCMATNSTSTGITAPSGLAQAWELGVRASELDDGLQPASGLTGAKLWTFSTGRAWAGWLVGLRPQ